MTSRSSASTAARGLRALGLLAALLFVAAPSLAQPTGSWQVHDGPADRHAFGQTVADGDFEGYLAGAAVPAASAPGWAAASAWPAASGDVSVQWAGRGGAGCRAAAGYTYFQTAVFPAAGDRYALAFFGVDDAVRVTVYNERHPGGTTPAGGVVGLRDNRTVDLTPALMAGATNRVVLSLADVCGPGNGLAAELVVEPGEALAFEAGDDAAGGGTVAACLAGVETLLANNYDFATTPDPRAVRPGADLSFVDALARYDAVSGDCRELLEEPEAFVPADRMAGLRALVARHQTVIAEALAPAHTFTEWVGYLDGSAGLEQQGRRVPQYCPQQHRRQFSCDVAPERIALSGRLLVEVLRYMMGEEMAEASAAPARQLFRLTSMSYDGAECLEGNGRGGQFGGNAVMTPCGNGNGQHFDLVETEIEGAYRLKTENRGPNECLESNARDSGTMNGAAFMDDCQDVSGQLWQIVPTQHEGWARLKSLWRGENECLEANGRGSSVHGGAAFMDACQDVTGQYWRILPVEN